MQNVNINVNPEDLQDIVCENCNGEFFTPCFMIKRLSAIQSPNGQEMMFPVQVFKCDSCGEVLNKFEN
jgi:hypothetical protein